MDKKIILKNYLNTINLGNNTLGVKAAALRYFDKDVSELTLSEANGHRRYHPEPVEIQPALRERKKAQRGKTPRHPPVHVRAGKITKEEQEEALADDVYSRIKNVDIVTKRPRLRTPTLPTS